MEDDRWVRVDDKPVTAETFKQLISEYQPGQSITLVFQKGDIDLKEDAFTSIDVTVADKSQWFVYR